MLITDSIRPKIRIKKVILVIFLSQVQKKHNVLSKMPPRSPVGSQTTIADTPDSSGVSVKQEPASPPQNTGVPVRFYNIITIKMPRSIVVFLSF